MEQEFIEKRNQLISSLFKGGTKVNFAPDQLLNATLFVWQKKYRVRGVRTKVTLPGLRIEDRQLSLLALQVSFGMECESLVKAFEISDRTFRRDINLLSVALLSSRKYQQAYAKLCTDILFCARWYHQYNHLGKENS